MPLNEYRTAISPLFQAQKSEHSHSSANLSGCTNTTKPLRLTMGDAAGNAPKPKGRGFFEVGFFKKLRVTDAVRERRMGSEFIVQVCEPRVLPLLDFKVALDHDVACCERCHVSLGGGRFYRRHIIVYAAAFYADIALSAYSDG